MLDFHLTKDEFSIQQPSEEQIEKHLTFMGTNKAKIKSEVEQIKSWLSSHPILPTVEDEKFLERFHAHCKYKIEKTKRKLESYYRTRALEPDFMLDRDPVDQIYNQVKDIAAHATLPLLTPEGYRVTIFRMFNPDPELYDPEYVLKSSLMMLDSCINEDLCIAHVLVIDAKGFTARHLLKMTPSYLKKVDKCSTRAFPHRYANIHFLNVMNFMQTTINLYKMLLGNKMSSRIILHTEYNSFHDYIPKHILPKEYGGTYHKSIEEIRDMSFNKMLQKRDWFLKERNIFADLKNDPDGFDEIFGSKGTFRKIQID